MSYFYPPSSQSAIVVYYERGNPDFGAPLFLLFHEAGHYLQFQEMKETRREADFRERMDVPTGRDRIAFEEECWLKGKHLLRRFIDKQGLDATLIGDYEAYAAASLKTYE